MVTVEDVRRVALALPRTEEALVRDQVKFRVRRIVYVAISRDEQSMGFGYPRDERAALIAAEPAKFFPPAKSDERYQWVQVRLAAIEPDELSELVVDAWRMVVPKRVAAEHLGG
ncbi:MAG TPA: MmcQ/YjbR family DNA-binding protein [Mycobacteriales bacterium]|nr:MmcQ/YjbR family DNA-binding protein [Mycobacteriales bacterium]